MNKWRRETFSWVEMNLFFYVQCVNYNLLMNHTFSYSHGKEFVLIFMLTNYTFTTINLLSDQELNFDLLSIQFI